MRSLVLFVRQVAKTNTTAAEKMREIHDNLARLLWNGEHHRATKALDRPAWVSQTMNFVDAGYYGV